MRAGGQVWMDQHDPQPGWGLRGPLLFGVIAATIELAIVLAVLYC